MLSTHPTFLHQLADTRHEVAVAWRVSAAHVADNEELPGLPAQAPASPAAAPHSQPALRQGV